MLINIYLDIERLKLGFRLLYFPNDDYIEFPIYLAFKDLLLIGTILVYVIWSYKLLVLLNY
jgi:hypothetical protein